MERREAIAHVVNLSEGTIGEFTAGAAEEAEARAKTRDALKALGCTDAEIDYELGR